jgi:hypothetical protein
MMVWIVIEVIEQVPTASAWAHYEDALNYAAEQAWGELCDPESSLTVTSYRVMLSNQDDSIREGDYEIYVQGPDVLHEGELSEEESDYRRDRKRCGLDEEL